MKKVVIPNNNLSTSSNAMLNSPSTASATTSLRLISSTTTNTPPSTSVSDHIQLSRNGIPEDERLLLLSSASSDDEGNDHKDHRRSLEMSLGQDRAATVGVGIGENILPDDAVEGLFNIRAIMLLFCWYFFSFCTLFLNKYILSYLQGEPTLLGACQMLSTTVYGFIQMYVSCGMFPVVERRGQPTGFIRNMLIVGCMRFSTVVLGLIALKYISVSFTETVKSSAPIFTVIIAWCILGETSGPCTMTSLVPVMGGLALCSAYELSFHMIGFLAALATNIMDCLQNVFSKLLISGEDYRYTPAELQFYTSVASVAVQIPASYFVMDIEHAIHDLRSQRLAFALLTNGLCFHLQSIAAYSLMGYISPVTHSVANTAKRAILIWMSVLVFGNEVTLLSATGTVTVFLGVICYNRARDYEKLKYEKWNTHGKKGGRLSCLQTCRNGLLLTPSPSDIQLSSHHSAKVHDV